MNDMTPVITPKSDQISADDFIAGPRTFTIESVEIRPGTEQPVSIFLMGEQRAWKPCKSMSRVLVAAWGADASKYAGKGVTLYRDPTVKWGGMEVGGIRISHISHIEAEMRMQLTATKGKRALSIIKPLAMQAPSADREGAEKWAATHTGLIQAAATVDELNELQGKSAKILAKLQKTFPDLHQQVEDEFRTAMIDLMPNEQGRPDEQHGDQHDGDDDVGF